MSLLRTLLGLVMVLSLLSTGCGGGGVVARGKVVKGGQPIKVGDKGAVRVSLTPSEGTVTTVYTENAKPDGSFEIKGPNGKAIPAGKYKVGVQAFDPYPTKDTLNGKFAPDKTTIVREVGSGELLIDLDKP